MAGEVVLKNWRTTYERVEKFISKDYFTDVNLRGRLYKGKADLTKITHYKSENRIPYCDAVQQVFTDACVGASFGPTWTTHWFRLEYNIPAKWIGAEVHLIWDSGSEALVWQDEQPCQGLNTDFQRRSFCISKSVAQEETKNSVYIEMVCNGLFGAGQGDQLIQPPDLNKMYTLKEAHVALFDRQVYDVLIDLEMLLGIAKGLKEKNRGYQALYAANKIVNACVGWGSEWYSNARDIAGAFFCQSNGASQHVTVAVGHCHMDSAWLWPYAETIRKCARSWSSTVRLMSDFTDFKFACSQAQQFEWVKQHYPGLYTKIKALVKQGRFIPVGGVWVEMDGNLPSGESFVRQFLYGQRYFKQEFGAICKEFWLPDTFGYSAQLPQIMCHMNITRFLTQKLSWSLVNTFPHHTFWWQGIDGSKVLSHFPPGDNYGMAGEVHELLKTVDNFRDKGRSNRSMYLFGYGDGGQGPSEDMLQRLSRVRDCDGLPKVDMSTPDDFFSHVEREESDQLCTWKGELYLELHNGTYTTQAQTKKGNRECEVLLHDVETIWSVAHIGGAKYPAQEVERLWKLLLLNQFHDVLPGSSINEVYKDALEYYADIRKNGSRLRDEALAALCSQLSGGNSDNEACQKMVYNSTCWPRKEVVIVEAATDGQPPTKRNKQQASSTQTDRHGNSLGVVSTAACSVSKLTLSDIGQHGSVSVKQRGNVFILENPHLTVTIDATGRIVSCRLKQSHKDALKPADVANQFVIYDDVPLFWDAWDVMDYHLETRQPVSSVLEKCHIVEDGPLRVAVETSLKISDTSTIKQVASLDVTSLFVRFDTQVEWHENRKFLKVEFPLNVSCTEATYDIQFGHLKRPTHRNTSWDWARYEVCGHKWADLSEHNFGVAVLNDCKYGWSAHNSTLQMSVLRSAKAPDAEADMGLQTFAYAFMPHTGDFQTAGVIQQAYCFSQPLHSYKTITTPTNSCPAFFSLNTNQVILENVKKHEDLEQTLVLRLYEAWGGECSAQLIINLNKPVKQANWCNGLEEVIADSQLDVKTTIEGQSTMPLTFKPFQLRSLLLTF